MAVGLRRDYFLKKFFGNLATELLVSEWNSFIKMFRFGYKKFMILKFNMYKQKVICLENILIKKV